MLKFNNNNIFTGYLKQLLNTFNLPKYRVYTAENKRYHDWAVAQNNPDIPTEKDILETIEPVNLTFPNNLRYALYIKDGTIQKYINNEWVSTNLQYFPNKPELNQTKKLNLSSNIYDSYTHEYLGEFLRFIRDYYDINLMPLYNCFSDTLCPNLNLKLSSKTEEAIFDTKNTNFKIYMLPVKLFKKYTIAIDSDMPVELCCGFYGAYQDDRDKLKNISNITYLKVNSCKFNSPFIYDKLASDILDQKLINSMELAQNEPDLKLFIKIPASNRSSITILEGDYSGYNNIIYKQNGPFSWTYSSNKFITNYATSNKAYIINKNNPDIISLGTVDLPAVEDREFNPITKLQLLELNTGVSYPFADRLIEYLVGNTITSEEQITDNIKRVQTILAQWNIHFPVYGAWSNNIRNIIYDYMTSKIPANSSVQHDILGYVDKDAETYFVGKQTLLNKYPTSIANAYIYPEIYHDSQKIKGGNK